MAKRRARAPSEEIEKRIMPVSEADEFVKILVYGRNGQGKTRFAASAPNVLIIDINEKGTKSARSFKGAKVFPVRDWEDMSDIYWYLKKGNHKFESVAIDTITAMQELCMSHVLGEEAEKDPNRDRAMPRRQDWGKMGELMKIQLLNYRNLDMHVIFTAQEREVGDEDSGEEVMRVPDLSPKPRGIAMGSVDIIGRIYQREAKKKVNGKVRRAWETRMLVGPHEVYSTKDRTYALGRIVRNPNVPNIITASEGGGG